MTVCSNDTLGNTPFQLISDFFHVNKVLSVLSMLSKLPPGPRGVLEGGRGGGGGGGGATGLLNKGGGINRLPRYRLVNNNCSLSMLWRYICIHITKSGYVYLKCFRNKILIFNFGAI